MLEQYPDIMTPEQVAEVLQLSLDETNELLLSNEIPSKKIGKFWRVPKASLIDFLNPQNNQSATPASPIEKEKTHLTSPLQQDNQPIVKPTVEKDIKI